MDAVGALDEAERPRHRPFLIGVSGGTASGKVSPFPAGGISRSRKLASHVASSANVSTNRTVKAGCHAPLGQLANIFLLLSIKDARTFSHYTCGLLTTLL